MVLTTTLPAMQARQRRYQGRRNKAGDLRHARFLGMAEQEQKQSRKEYKAEDRVLQDQSIREMKKEKTKRKGKCKRSGKCTSPEGQWSEKESWTAPKWTP